jgi:hypothetical protein
MWKIIFKFNNADYSDFNISKYLYIKNNSIK